jgi:hypothetical protein
MKTRLLFVALAVLGLGSSLSAQSTTPQLFPFKFGPLKSGDTLIVRMYKESLLVTGTRARLTLSVVIDDDGKLKLNAPINVPLLNNVTAAGLWIPELQKMLEGRYAENNHDTSVTVEFRPNPIWAPRLPNTAFN